MRILFTISHTLTLLQLEHQMSILIRLECDWTMAVATITNRGGTRLGALYHWTLSTQLGNPNLEALLGQYPTGYNMSKYVMACFRTK